MNTQRHNAARPSSRLGRTSAQRNRTTDGRRAAANQRFDELHPVKPVAPPAAYCGGKRFLAPAIIERISKVPHNTYAEPFVGMGGVFLRRTSRPRKEVINDFNGDIANLFRILQRHYSPFMEMFRFQLASRQEFDRLLAVDPDLLTDLERAARFLYVQRAAFGGNVVGRRFGVAPKNTARFNLSTLGPSLEKVHRRLCGVVIEGLTYKAFIERYDRQETLFYLDPPYFGMEDYYGKNLFSPEDFSKLAQLLANISGRFILSLNDTPEVRRIFAQFQFETLPVTYSMPSGMAKQTHELLISGPAR